LKALSAALAILLFGSAPFQCRSDPNPTRRLQDTPAEALWQLSEEFRAEGDEAARRTTLQRLVERYPGTREAERAQQVLDGHEVPPDPSIPRGRDDGIVPELDPDDQPEPNPPSEEGQEPQG